MSYPTREQVEAAFHRKDFKACRCYTCHLGHAYLRVLGKLEEIRDVLPDVEFPLPLTAQIREILKRGEDTDAEVR